MESSIRRIRDIFIFWKLSWGLENIYIIHSSKTFKNDNICLYSKTWKKIIHSSEFDDLELYTKYWPWPISLNTISETAVWTCVLVLLSLRFFFGREILTFCFWVNGHESQLVQYSTFFDSSARSFTAAASSLKAAELLRWSPPPQWKECEGTCWKIFSLFSIRCLNSFAPDCVVYS